MTISDEKAIVRRKIATVKPMDLVKSLRPHYDAREVTAKSEISDAIRSGELFIWAKSWISEQRPSQSVWDAGPPAATKRRKVRQERFLGAKNWERDAKNWKWNSGCFYLTRNDQKSWLMMKGVKFHECKVSSFIERVRIEKSGPGGRPKRYDQWNIALIRIVEMTQNGELTEDALSGEKAFFKAFRAGLSPELSLNLTDAALRPINQLIRENIVACPSGCQCVKCS